MNTFLVAPILEDAWNITKKSYWSWFPVVILAAVIPGGLFLISGLFGAAANNIYDDFGSTLVGLIATIFWVAAILASFYMSLGVIRNAYFVSGGGTKPSVARLFEYSNYWWFVLATMLYTGIVVIGLFFLILPGLIFAFMLTLYGYSLVSGQTTNGVAALGVSWDRISHHFWGYIGYRIVLIGVPAALFVAFIMVLGVGGLGAASGSGALTALVSLIALVALFFAGIFAIAFTVIADGLAFRKLDPSN